MNDFNYKKLGLNSELLASALDSAKRNGNEYRKYLPFLLRGRTSKTKKFTPLEKLALVLYALPSTYENYKQKGIPDEIFFSTFSDIKIWCDNAYEQYGTAGLVNVRWLAKHLSMRIFRLGRLQFEFSRFAILPHAKFKNVISCPYRLGEKCIALHIPQGEKLDSDACLRSFASANAFFAEYYPDYKYRCYNVITWLLDPELEQVLSKDRNIVKFGKTFTLLGRVPDNDMNERRIFGYKKDRANYSPKNALQRYILDRINKGKPLYSYNGFVSKDVFDR